jgi:protein-disulfide isomerase
MKTMRNLTRTASLLALAALSLSACGKKEEEVTENIQENIVTEVPIDEAIPANVDDAPPPAPAPLNVTNTVAPPPAFTDKEQMRDDADATGLTSRLPSDEAPTGAANETQPVK